MTSHDVAVDDILFDYVVNAVYDSCGLDMCFSLLREFSRQDLPIPEGLYRSLVALGIDVGVLERTLHVAYNMECDGWRLSSQLLHDLMMMHWWLHGLCGASEMKMRCFEHALVAIMGTLNRSIPTVPKQQVKSFSGSSSGSLSCVNGGSSGSGSSSNKRKEGGGRKSDPMWAHFDKVRDPKSKKI
ncbi:hypothetical protein PsorP6_006606 [Peronosclerospora sorghi]|uniref:Uncharacterized protein n=1 Tax=Peronosclerospora sorghi TaxID=230839 RepID=A0ACC0W5T5_9STRA|nr:hypothetical protein PsorP6_006606 [Peronosclerospora sorghi]